MNIKKTDKNQKEQKINFRMTNYAVGDFMIRVKNAALAGNKEATLGLTKAVAGCAEALKRAGFLDSVKVDGRSITVALTFKNKEPYITGIKLISKPGLRIYKNIRELGKLRGPSVLIISTPLGILNSKEAKKKGVGGEVIADVW